MNFADDEGVPRPLALRDSRIKKAEQEVPSEAENRLVLLFDELRVPLLQYLCHFPLCVQDAEDVIQEAFLSLHRQFLRGRSIEEVRGWLFRAAHSLALKKRLRSQRELDHSGTVAEGEAVASGLNPEELAASRQTHRNVQSVVSALPEQDRWCLYLRVEGLRYRQIAEVLNISLGSVSNSLQRSLARIVRTAER